MISLPLGPKTGVMIVISGRCLENVNSTTNMIRITYDPPAMGEFTMRTSPSLRSLECSFIWYFTALEGFLNGALNEI